MLTQDQIQRSLPANLKSAATPKLTDLINTITNDPLVAEQVQHNFMSYTKVLSEGKFKTEDYVHAVAYVSYKLMGYSNQDAYFRTFPTRHQNLLAAGKSSKDIAAYVAVYARGKMVNMIMEQALVPTWVLNQATYQEAINVQAELMRSAQSEKVRSDAANSILTHLTKPKEAGPLVSIDMRETSGMNELRHTLTEMAKMQQSMMANGASVKQVAAQEIIDVEAKVV